MKDETYDQFSHFYIGSSFFSHFYIGSRPQESNDSTLSRHYKFDYSWGSSKCQEQCASLHKSSLSQMITMMLDVCVSNIRPVLKYRLLTLHDLTIPSEHSSNKRDHKVAHVKEPSLASLVRAITS